MRFTEEERDALEDLVFSVNLKPLKLVYKAMLEKQERELLDADLNDGAEILAYKKARYEGAKAFAHNVGAEVDRLKKMFKDRSN